MTTQIDKPISYAMNVINDVKKIGKAELSTDDRKLISDYLKSNPEMRLQGDLAKKAEEYQAECNRRIASLYLKAAFHATSDRSKSREDLLAELTALKAQVLARK